MNDKLRVAVVGCGAQAQLAHIPALKQDPEVELVALCDPDVRKLNHLCAQHGIKRHYVDFDDLKEAEGVDAVVIATPNHLHAPMAISALQYGKHVLVEMPMALNATEAEAMMQAAEREKRLLTPCLAARLRPDVQTVRRFIEGDELGKLYYCKTGWLQGRESWALAGWRGQRLRAGGGAFLGLGTTLLDVSLLLLAPSRPLSVVGVAHHRDPRAEVEDTAFAMIRFESGLLLTVEVSWSMLMEKDFTYMNLLGNSGAALLNPIQIHKEMHGHLVNVTPQLTVKEQTRQSYRDLIRGWVESLLRGAAPAITAADGLVVSRIADAFYRSHATGGEVSLPSESH